MVVVVIRVKVKVRVWASKLLKGRVSVRVKLKLGWQRKFYTRGRGGGSRDGGGGDSHHPSVVIFGVDKLSREEDILAAGLVTANPDGRAC